MALTSAVIVAIGLVVAPWIGLLAMPVLSTSEHRVWQAFFAASGTAGLGLMCLALGISVRTSRRRGYPLALAVSSSVFAAWCWWLVIGTGWPNTLRYMGPRVEAIALPQLAISILPFAFAVATYLSRVPPCDGMYHVGSTTIGRLQKLLRAVVGTALCLVAAPLISLVAAATLSTDGAAVVYAAVYFGCGIGSVLLVCATIPIVRRAALFRALPMMLAASSTVQAAYSFGLVVAAVWPETYGYGAVLFLMIYGGTAILSCFLATLIRLYCMPLTPPDDVQHDFLGPR